VKIYTLLSSTTNLSQISGDKINELAIYSAMSLFADVYYNNQKLNFDAPNFGVDINRPIEKPSKKYDFYYIRAAPKIFLSTHGPKAWMASPYNDLCYREADAIVTFTNSWKKLLTKGSKVSVPGLTRGLIERPKKVITFDQVVPDFFVPKKDHAITSDFRSKFNADFIIGHFGRMSKATYPHSLMLVVDRLRNSFPDKKIELIHAGNIQSNVMAKVKNNIRSMGRYKYENMPYAISACDVVTCNSRQGAANWAGCKDVLEGMACGVPVLSGNYEVRKEQLGADYEFFWPYDLTSTGPRISQAAEDAMFNHLKKIIDYKFFNNTNDNWLDLIINNQLKRVKYYRKDNVAKRIEKDIIDVINNFKK